MALVLLAFGIWFPIGFSDNLHCDQYTSFRIATFDMTPHDEEAMGGPPLVYLAPFAIPLRILLSTLLLALLWLPGAGAAAVIANLVALRLWRRLFGALILASLAASLAPGVGERSALFLNALVPTIVLGLPLSVTLGLAVRPLSAD